jgi:hypothetical protein
VKLCAVFGGRGESDARGVLTRSLDAWLGPSSSIIVMITKGFILAKDLSLIGTKIIREHDSIAVLPVDQRRVWSPGLTGR